MLLESAAGGISILRREMSGALKLLMVVAVFCCWRRLRISRAFSSCSPAARRREIAVRLALGGSRSRLIAQLMTENVPIALPGASTGLSIAPELYNLLLAFQPQVAMAQTVFGQSLDWRVLLFTLFISLVSGVLFGLAPALQSAAADLVTALRGGEQRFGQSVLGLNLRHLFVVAQIAATLLMLVAGGLFIRTTRNLLAIDPGFRPENVLRVPLELPRETYDAQRSNQFYVELIERVRALPDFEAVTGTGRTPFDGSRGSMSIVIEGHPVSPSENIGVAFNQVGPGYHELMGIPVQRRGFTSQDRAGAPAVVIINEAMARIFSESGSDRQANRSRAR
jgi:hypothetical protein